ncbi:DNA topoisomerase [Vanrija albida]|uniref:DNA topoisomerase n=1 Tax=Vanrija albida TaxID=181172 RepID=A0ABR3QBI4_9TREE
MKVLCVAEKPSIAKSISEILAGGRFDSRAGQHKYCRNFDFAYRLPPPLGPQNGDCDFTVTSVLGHLTSSDFTGDYRNWNSCDPFDLFEAPVVTFVSNDLKPVEKNLQQEARRADLLMIWTDCDREGEHIGYEVVATCRMVNPRIVVKRARFSAIIAAQIHQACRQANDLDMRMVNAVETRQDLDLRLGAAFTRMMTMALQARFPELNQQEGGKVISYGPCQFPTLGFVVDQYNRVQSFVPEPFWHIAVSIERDSEDEEGATTSVNFTWRRGHLFDLNIAILLYEDCIERPMARVIKVETKPTTKFKPLPLTTVELQQSGSRLLGLAPKRVLDLAEKLYQKGFLSYPRTETDQYDKDFDFMSLVRKQTLDNVWGEYAQKLLDGAFEKPRNGRKNDKAHPPIHPTAAANNLDADERRVYELVTRRFLASCSTNAIGKQTTIEIQIAGEFFSTSGIVVLQRNYLEVYPYDKWTSNPLPDFEEGEEFMPTACELKEGSTTSPNLLTEADLVRLMDKNGIGTDATIAEHIAKIIDRGYVVTKQQQKSKYLVPSQLGIGLVEGYNAIGFDRSLSKPHLRREVSS